MHDSDQRALSRAALVLLVISLARWGAGARGDASALADGNVAASTGVGGLEGHLAETAAALEEEDRRSLPLEEGERLDPNVADVIELDRLPGVGPATARSVVAARDSGVVFRRTEDLLQVRGIGPASLDRLRPWLTLPGGVTVAERPASARRPRATGGGGAPVDINRADARTLETLPGIGPAIAGRILEERRARPFSSLDDLQRVQGIGPATVERLRGRGFAGSVR